MKSAKAVKDASEELRAHICQSSEPCLCHEEIIARHMAPKRERAASAVTINKVLKAQITAEEASRRSLKAQLVKERELARRVETALTELHEAAANKASTDHDGPRENCCDFCWAILAAAEGLADVIHGARQ